MQIEFEEMLKFSKELYSRTALIKAAYNFTDMAYIHLDADDHYYYVFISAKEDGKSISEKDFINEMLSQSVRHVVYKQTKTGYGNNNDIYNKWKYHFTVKESIVEKIHYYCKYQKRE